MLGPHVKNLKNICICVSERERGGGEECWLYTRVQTCVFVHLRARERERVCRLCPHVKKNGEKIGKHVYFEGSQPEWCISSMIYSRDTPFSSGALNLCVCF